MAIYRGEGGSGNATTDSTNQGYIASQAAADAQASAVSAASSASSAAASLDSFTDLYLGSKTSAPSVDNDGNTLQVGSIYWNSTSSQLYIWSGAAWAEAAFTTVGAVTSFNTRNGAITLTSADVTSALTYTPLGPSAIGTTVQGYDADLATIGGLDKTNGNFIVANGTIWVAEGPSTARTALGVTATGADTTYAYRANNLSDLNNAATARTNLGLGTIATQAASNVAITGGSITGITDLAVADGGTGSSTLSANAVLLGNGTSALQTVAPGTTGNVLTSNGTTWQSTTPATSGGMTLLGTITPTAVNSLSLGSLTLTSYKSLFIVLNNIVLNTGKTAYISSSNLQTGGGFFVATSGTAVYGTAWLDLTTGALGGGLAESTVTSTAANAIGGSTNVTIASTTIYFRMPSTNAFSAQGSIRIYGVT
jgi:hypothetical protein